MRHLLFAFLLILCAATILQAQNPYIPGSVQGGPPAPGTKSRSPLNSLERAANNVPGATILTDTFGNQRFSMFVYIADTCFTPAPTGNTSNLNSFLSNCAGDSTWYVDWTGKSTVLFAGGGGGGVNWYTVNDTTTDVTRTAYILQNAEWFGVDPNGYINMVMGDVSYGELYLDINESSVYHLDLGGYEFLRAVSDGVEITTSNTASRAVDITTDTMNWSSSFDPTFMKINYLADATYMYADSTKTVGIGQWKDIPGLNYDGTQKGFIYAPSSQGFIVIINGNGTSGAYADIEVYPNYLLSQAVFDANKTTYGTSEMDAFQAGESKWITKIGSDSYLDTASIFVAFQSNDAPKTTTKYVAMGERSNADIGAFAYLGRSPESGSVDIVSDKIAWGVQQSNPGGGFIFDWLKIDLYDDDTTRNGIAFYDQYRFSNTQPSTTSTDTSFHYWAGNGAGGTVPGFITLDQVCAHCAADAVNWYTSNGTTTDNTRIATVTETATWLSNDGDADGVFPFRFELEDASPNEPEMMVWLFPTGDSLALQQSDVEIQFHTNTDLSSWADGVYSMRADSATFNSNAGGTQWKITPNQIEDNVQRITQTVGANAKQDVLETVIITGTAQTELTMPTTGSVLNLPSNTVGNFEVHLVAVCTSVGDGVGISVGDTYGTWTVGAIKNIAGTTALVGGTQDTATPVGNTGMSTSAVTIDANDTNDSLRIRFTPPSTAGSTTVIKVIATIDFTQTSY